MARGWGKGSLVAAGGCELPPVREEMQFLTITGKKPWYDAAPVTSMMVFNFGKLGFLSRWMMEVSDFRAAALISMRWSPRITSTSTSVEKTRVE